MPYVGMNPSHEPPHSPSNNNSCDREPHGPEAWVRDAIAQQEEHLTRNRSCMGTLGRPHTYRIFGVPDSDGTIKNTATYRGASCVG